MNFGQSYEAQGVVELLLSSHCGRCQESVVDGKRRQVVTGMYCKRLASLYSPRAPF